MKTIKEASSSILDILGTIQLEDPDRVEAIIATAAKDFNASYNIDAELPELDKLDRSLADRLLDYNREAMKNRRLAAEKEPAQVEEPLQALQESDNTTIIAEEGVLRAMVNIELKKFLAERKFTTVDGGE